MPALLTPRYAALLADYAISTNGFVPAVAPLAHLPPAFDAWELVATQLPELIRSRRIRAVVDALPVLATDGLQTEEQWRRAYAVLAFLTHAYIWGGGEPATTIPPAITIPLLAACAVLDLPPVLSYAASNLWNFTSSSPTADFTQLSTLSVPLTFTGTPSEEWFFKISVAMEVQGASTIPRMLNALDAVPAGNTAEIAASLHALATAIDQTTQLLEQMHAGCDPHEFYHGIRPFLAGTKNMAAAGLPRGVFFDEGAGRGSWRALRGGSNGQSSLIQFWDVVLGVTHRGEPDGDADEPFHVQVRAYMPGPHRRFLEMVRRRRPSLRGFVAARDDDAELQQAYGAAVRALTVFRNAHIGIVTRYIVVPARKARARAEAERLQAEMEGGMEGKTEERTRNLATVSAGHGAEKELTGTGGTALMPFLKQSRDETVAAGRV